MGERVSSGETRAVSPTVYSCYTGFGIGRAGENEDELLCCFVSYARPRVVRLDMAYTGTGVVVKGRRKVSDKMA
jgi:hypothetical protein